MPESELQQARAQFDVTILREKALAVAETMDSRGVTERFTYLRRHFWITRDFARGNQITACICAKCVALGPIA